MTVIEESKRRARLAKARGAGGGGEYTADTIVRDVVRGLYEGRFAPGQRLVEPDLMNEYGVSRSTVREAIKQLTADGVAISTPFRGAHIRRLARADAANIFAITEVVLGLAARQAAGRIEQPGARAGLAACLAAILDHDEAGERFEFIRRRNRFFQKVVEISGNAELMTIIPKLQVHLIRNRLAAPRAVRDAGYAAMAEAIGSGDGAAAEAATRGYIARIAAYTLPYFDEI